MGPKSPGILGVTIKSPLLGTMERLPTQGRTVIWQGGEIVYDDDPPTSLGLDPRVVERDWYPDPWFTQALAEGAEQLLVASGFDIDARRIAAEGLRVAYPPEICREMGGDERRLEIIYGLYEPMTTGAMHLLSIGIDLHACHPDPRLQVLERLRWPQTFSAAAMEVWGWARLVRAGFLPELEPRGRNEKRPDFLVTGSGDACYIEVKTNPMPDAERLLWKLRDCVSPYIDNLEHPERYVQIKGTEALGEAFLGKDPAEAIDRLIDELKQDLLRIRKAILSEDFAAKDYPGGRYAEATVATEPSDLVGMRAIDLWAGFPDRKLVARVLRKVREANSQVPRGRKSIVVIDVGGLTNLALLQTELLFESKARPEDFDSVR